MTRRSRAAIAAELRAILETIADEGAGHPTLPVLTPHTYHRLDCTCGGCEVCRWFIAVEAESWALQGTEPRPPQISVQRPRWPSVEAALEQYVEHRQAGYTSPSQSGFVADVGDMGVIVQKSIIRRSTQAEKAAEDVVEVERVLWQACGSDPVVSASACVGIVLGRVVGSYRLATDRYGRTYRKPTRAGAESLGTRYDMSAQEVAGVMRRCMHRLRVEMASRGLVPLPDRSSRAYQETVQRMEGS